MDRRKKYLVYLDTHIVIWLYAGLTKKLSEKAKSAIENCEVYISQMVRLELQYLYEIGRIKEKPAKIINNLSKSIGLNVSLCPLNEIIDQSLKLTWTRDVFDRLLTAEAQVNKSDFVSADKDILVNCKQAIW